LILFDSVLVFALGCKSHAVFCKSWQAPAKWAKSPWCARPCRFWTSLPGKAVAQHRVSADNPGLVGSSWLRSQWETARALAAQAGGCILVLDEVQKLPGWTEEVKQLWDEDTRAGRDARVSAGCAGCKSMWVKWCASAAPARNYKCSTPP
jgi:hypothetical protein